MILFLVWKDSEINHLRIDILDKVIDLNVVLAYRSVESTVMVFPSVTRMQSISKYPMSSPSRTRRLTLSVF